MRQTKIVAVSNQKGGVGKTTISIIVASAFHFLARKKVAIIDCDYPQQSIVEFREKEVEAAEAELADLKSEGNKSPVRITELENALASAYPLIGCQVGEALGHIDRLMGEVDIIFLDMPGTMNAKGIQELWRKTDYIFIPVEPDKVSVTATITYIDTLVEFVLNKPNSRLKGYYPFWNKYVKSEKQTLYERTEEYFRQNDIHQLKARLEQSVSYRKDDMRSSLFPLKDKYLDLGIRTLIEEMSSIIFPAPAAPSNQHPVS